MIAIDREVDRELTRGTDFSQLCGLPEVARKEILSSPYVP